MRDGGETGRELRTIQVFEALRFDLLESRIRPGERLKLVELAERFGISQTVVREALTRLCEQGLVISNPKRGFTAAPLSVDDLVDLTNVRLRLETMAFADSIRNGDLTWETNMVAAHHALERTPFVTEAPQHAATWRQAHRAFHQALCAGSGSPRLEKVVSQLRDSAELYRIWSRSLGGERARDVAGEHRDLLDAALDRDVERATRLLTEHISRTTEVLLAVAETIGQGD
ncbi:GntR family transcriptional regulator [Ruixingdingia sedimenti]|uniref:GntR family transcriptional regulator n=1 Tax=Ruixingdingia sedimenti TaxID=3073604 RepID=A0ABU1FBM2_9RHOB|nr:GntR family transcriptional regulator [Xinfangfangia sp. LG-4]MDR5654008.1 GntR family transcriptional regulator [Xinfangfangia sp. LG-4]